jgi:hypothetical protein
MRASLSGRKGDNGEEKCDGEAWNSKRSGTWKHQQISFGTGAFVNEFLHGLGHVLTVARVFQYLLATSESS